MWINHVLQVIFLGNLSTTAGVWVEYARHEHVGYYYITMEFFSFFYFSAEVYYLMPVPTECNDLLIPCYLYLLKYTQTQNYKYQLYLFFFLHFEFNVCKTLQKAGTLAKISLSNIRQEAGRMLTTV